MNVPMFTVTITLIANDARAPKGKLADAELLFDNQTELFGLKLTGFSVWEGRQPGQRNVTFPARTYTVNGERRSFALLREREGVGHTPRQWLSNLIIASYDDAVRERDAAPAPAPQPTPQQRQAAARPTVRR